MGLFDSIFGSSPRASTETRSTLSPEQQELLTQLSGIFSSATPTREFSPYTGNFTAGLSDLEGLSLSALEQRTMQGADQSIQSQTLDSATQLLSQIFGSGGADTAGQFARRTGDILAGGGAGPGTDAAMETLMQLLGGQGQDISDVFQKSIVAPLTKTFQEEIIPGISRRAAGTGNLFSSDRAKTEDRALGELSDALASAGADLTFRSEESARNRALQAAGLISDVEGGATDRLLRAAGMEGELANADVGSLLESLGLSADLATTGAGIESQDIADLISIMDAGSVTRDIEQRELDAQYQEFLRQQGFDDQTIRLMLALLGTPTVENISTVTQGSSGILEPIASGLGSYLAAVSDRRLKKNIVRIGHLANLPIYIWDWINDKIPYPTIGVIAQEAQQFYPDAVFEGSDGYLMVDYSKIEV